MSGMEIVGMVFIGCLCLMMLIMLVIICVIAYDQLKEFRNWKK